MKELDMNNSELVMATDYTRKLTIDGITRAYEVKKIKLNCLYYNNQNDRIATWLSKYESENGQIDIESSEYNDIIHDMIIESNPEAFKKTKKNIELYEQREPGVVLRDGRIIDGNRRFTCLRELSKDDPKFGYFEAVVLDQTYGDESGKKAIKALELTIQHGTDKQVDYDPINRLVGIYRDLIEDGHSFTTKEYAKYVGQKEHEVQKSVEVATLMIEYLQFINAPKQFYIAVNQNINGPLVEMQSILKKITSAETREEMKYAMFSAILYGTGDVTRDIRRFGKIATNVTPEFLSAQKEIVDLVTDKVNSINVPMTQEIISEQIQNDEELGNNIRNVLNDEFDRLSLMAARDAPISLVSQALIKVSAIDDVSIKIVEQKDELRTKLDALGKTVSHLRALLDE